MTSGHGCSEKPLSQKAVGLRLAERGLDSARVGKSQARTWLGIGLKSDEPSPLDPSNTREADACRRDFRHKPSNPSSRGPIRENASECVYQENASTSGGYDESLQLWDDHRRLTWLAIIALAVQFGLYGQARESAKLNRNLPVTWGVYALISMLLCVGLMVYSFM